MPAGMKASICPWCGQTRVIPLAEAHKVCGSVAIGFRLRGNSSWRSCRPLPDSSAQLGGRLTYMMQSCGAARPLTLPSVIAIWPATKSIGLRFVEGTNEQPFFCSIVRAISHVQLHARAGSLVKVQKLLATTGDRHKNMPGSASAPEEISSAEHGRR